MRLTSMKAKERAPVCSECKEENGSFGNDIFPFCISCGASNPLYKKYRAVDDLSCGGNCMVFLNKQIFYFDRPVNRGDLIRREIHFCPGCGKQLIGKQK